MRPTQITIDLPALAHNLQQVKTLAPQSNVLAMVKANAYGHGAIECLPALQQAEAVGVASLTEALDLINAGWTKPIVLIEGVFSQVEWADIQAYNIECVIHNQVQLNWFLAQPNDKPVWLKLNTGMNRLGFSQDDILLVAKQIAEKGNLIILTSHFANADEKDHPMNKQQCQIFHHCLSQLKSKISPMIQGSLCNSAGIMNFPAYHSDWVRPGIMLYGSTPLANKTASELNLRPVMTLSAHIFATHELKAGESVGYGSRWIANTLSRIGIVSVGYGDGYPRVIADAAYVVAENVQQLPIIGRVAMDMLMVDLTAYPDIALGSTVTLWGNALSVDTVAQWNSTIGYELLCRVTARPIRHYIPLHPD